MQNGRRLWEAADLALHGHDEDGGGAVADDQVVQVVGVEVDGIDCQLPRAGLWGPEGLHAFTAFPIPHPHRRIRRGCDHLQPAHFSISQLGAKHSA